MIAKETYKPIERLTFETVEANTVTLKNHLNQDSCFFYLDLSEVEHCDVAGIAWLIDVMRRCYKLEKQVVMLGFTEVIAVMAKLCGVLDLFQKILVEGSYDQQ